MSSNFLINNINKEYSNIELYKNTINDIKNKKTNHKKTKLNYIEEKSIFLKNKQNLMILEKSYNDSLNLLEMIKKQTEKNILKKYNIEKKDKKITNVRNEIINNILMKKKFLITLLHF